MVINKQSHAFNINLDKLAWFADSGATEHMTEHIDWFTTFKLIPSNTWSVIVADDKNLWVQGIGDINITRTVDGIQKKGVLQKVLFIPELRRNLFSIGLASKAGLSFQTLREKCALYQDLGKGPKVMEGIQIGTLYKLFINPILPTSSNKVTVTNQHSSTALTTTSNGDADLVLWHNRMGLVSSQVLKNMSAYNTLQDFTASPGSNLPSICHGCAIGKQHKTTYPKNPYKERSKVPGELLHADLCGKMSHPSLGGAYYYILIKDDCTSYRFVAFLKAKGHAIRFFLKVLRSIECTIGNRVKTLRPDRGKEFCNMEFDLLLEHEGIARETNMPYTPQHNGYVEQDNRTICEAARSMLHLHHLPLKLWAEFVHTHVYILNRIINSQVGFVTPHELWFKTKPTVSHYITFKTVAYIFTNKSLRTKFQPKGTMVIFVGYSDTSKGWRFWHPITDLISESSNVLFDEATRCSTSSLMPNQVKPVAIPTHLIVNPIIHQNNPVPLPPSVLVPLHDSVGASLSTDSIPPLEDDNYDISLPTSQNHISSSPSLSLNQTADAIHSLHVFASNPCDYDIPSSSQPFLPHPSEELAHPKVRSLTDIYSASSRKKSATSQPPLSFANMIHVAETCREPTTYKQTTMSPQAAYWKAIWKRSTTH